MGFKFYQDKKGYWRFNNGPTGIKSSSSEPIGNQEWPPVIQQFNSNK